MKSLLRRTAMLASITLPLLVLAAFFSDAAMAAGLDSFAPTATPVPVPVDDGLGFLGWFSLYLSAPLIRVGGALLFFVVGWVAAKSISFGVYTLLSKTEFDNKLAQRLGLNLLMKESHAEGGTLERFVAKVVYILLMLLVVVGVLQIAGFSQVAQPLQGLVDTVVQALPRIAKAALILLVAYIIGRILKIVITGGLDRMGVDSRFAKLTESPEDDVPGSTRSFSQVAGNVAFWLLIVFGLAGALEALDIEPLAAPLRNAIDRVVGLLPRLAIASLLVFVGYVLGRVLRVLVRNVLHGLGFDRLVARVGLDKATGTTTPSDLVGVLVMAFVMLQASIAALNELGLETISVPLTAMLARFWNILPALAASIIIVVAGVFVGRLLRRLVGTALRNIGFDRLMEKLGFNKITERDDRLGEFSEMVAFGVQVGVVLLAVAQALDNLGLDTWSLYVNSFLTYLVKNVAVALLVVLVGFVIGGYVRDLIHARQGDNEPGKWVAEFARYMVLVFAFTMAVRQLDVAEDFVLLTFGLLFGALCLAIGLAFGLGSREVAHDIVKRRYEEARSKMNKPTPPSSTGGGFGSTGGTGGGLSPKPSLGGPKPPVAGGGIKPPTP